MAIEFLLPNGDDSGWTTGGFADVDELVSAPNDGDFIETALNGKGETILLDLSASALADADTINTVTINVRARLNVGSPATIGAALFIGGVIQGAINSSSVLSSSFVNYAINASQWNVDWTAAQLAGMQIQFTAQQSGMPVDIQVQVSACDAEIDYTAGAGGPSTPQGLHGIDQGINVQRSSRLGGVLETRGFVIPSYLLTRNSCENSIRRY